MGTMTPDPGTAPAASGTETGGVRLAVDVGSVRVGVAASDPAGVLAMPVETVPRDAEGRSDLDRIAGLADERRAAAIVVGLPLRLAGDEGPAALAARGFAAALATRVAPLPVRLVDERLTTVSAARRMREAGVSSRAGKARVDQAAAVELLQSALDLEKRSGTPAGELVAAVAGPDGRAGD